jgi:hypothetical protein
MRDIRRDLRERIAAEEQKRERLRRELELLESIIGTYSRLLELEDQKFKGDGPEERQDRSIPQQPLQLFLLSIITHVPKPLDQLREEVEAAGYSFEKDQSPGRVVHGALVNPMRQGSILRDDKGRYYVATRPVGLATPGRTGRELVITKLEA